MLAEASIILAAIIIGIAVGAGPYLLGASATPTPNVSFHTAKPLTCAPGQLRVYIVGADHEAKGHCEEP